MKKFIISLIVIVGFANLLACLPEGPFFDIKPPEAFVPDATSEEPTPNLQHTHFTVMSQIEENIYFGSANQPAEFTYRIIDIHLAWLEYPDGSKSKNYSYYITHKIDYTEKINHSSPEDLCGKTFKYDNGFKIDDSVTIECQTQIESFDDVSIFSNGKYLHYSSAMLECCQITPLSLCFTDYNSSTLHGTVTFSVTSPDGNPIEEVEQSLVFGLF